MNKMVVRILAGMLTAIICTTTAVSTGNYKGGVKEVRAATVVNNPRIVPDSSMEAGQKVTWDCIWFGNYPQTEVVEKGSDWEEALELEEEEKGYEIEYESVSQDKFKKIENAVYDSHGDAVIDGSGIGD